MKKSNSTITFLNFLTDESTALQAFGFEKSDINKDVVSTPNDKQLVYKKQTVDGPVYCFEQYSEVEHSNDKTLTGYRNFTKLESLIEALAK
jgi:hypothetical protein